MRNFKPLTAKVQLLAFTWWKSLELTGEGVKAKIWRL